MREAALEPPRWVEHIVVEADAGFAATKTFQMFNALGYGFVFGAARTRRFTNGKTLRDLVTYLPRSRYGRRASLTPDGRRADYRVWRCRGVEVTSNDNERWFAPGAPAGDE